MERVVKPMTDHSSAAGDEGTVTRAAGYMVAAMLFFAVQDAMIKHLSVTISVAQVLLTLGVGGTIVFWLRARARGLRVFHPALRSRDVQMRSLVEMCGTMTYPTALAIAPLSTVSAIAMTAPLFVTLGAALVLKEKVGPRRWAAVFIGMLGMLLILRPSGEAFGLGGLLAVLATLCLSARDVITRRVPQTIPTELLTLYGFASVIPGGLILLAFGGGFSVPSLAEAGYLAACIVTAVLAYLTITMATRIGDVSAVIPYRYTRLVFALVIGFFAFAERPDALTLLGAGIIVASGLYALWRENRAQARMRRGHGKA
ncbi:DMT family transporter [Alphaproteobacteria bacterium KMM 3653]|uniref:DMT family transporter n=1 Tax=Harenicola maris TaxID=2841044 RepID=A0AAP2CSY7_9RHOB|nr:DMT family transporter [Harenicola maris]